MSARIGRIRRNCKDDREPTEEDTFDVVLVQGDDKYLFNFSLRNFDELRAALTNFKVHSEEPSMSRG